MDRQMPSPNRLISVRKKDVLGVAAFFGIVLLLGNVFTLMLIRSAMREYTDFGEKELSEIGKYLGITVTGDVTPVRMETWQGGGDYGYELWLEDIADPEAFLDECFEGSYTLLKDGKAGLEEQLSYSENGTTEGATIYECSLTAKGYNKFDHYYMAFYHDGGSYKAKIYASKL